MAVDIQELLFSRILEALVQLAEIPTKQPGHTAKATIDKLQDLLPAEHRADFNRDMEHCLVMSTHSLFDLSPKTVATNILPVYANFIATQIVRALINYHPNGVPIEMTFEIAADYRATTQIKWAYSIPNPEDNQTLGVPT